MFITVAIRRIYGNETIYPVCDKAELFARIAGTRTLTREVIKQIKSLGYEVRVDPEVPTTL